MWELSVSIRTLVSLLAFLPGGLLSCVASEFRLMGVCVLGTILSIGQAIFEPFYLCVVSGVCVSVYVCLSGNCSVYLSVYLSLLSI